MAQASVIPEALGEVIFSTNEQLVAQCYKDETLSKAHKQRLFQGSIVRIESSYDNSHVAYGIIAKINNSSLDNIHKPQALGLTSKELKHLQPQVYDLLRMELEIYLFAHTEGDKKIIKYPPLKPMMIHDFLYSANDEEALVFTEDFSNLITVIKKNQLNPDLIVDLINLGYKLRGYNYTYLVESGKKLSLAFMDEVESLVGILKRISPSK